MQVYLVLALAFAVLVAAFAVQNADPIVVRFIGWELQTSLVVVILGAAALGALSAGLAGFFRQVGMGLKIRSLQGQTQRLSQEADTLRTQKEDLQQELSRLDAQLEQATQRSSEVTALPGPTDDGMTVESDNTPAAGAAEDTPAAGEDSTPAQDTDAPKGSERDSGSGRDTGPQRS